MARVSTNIRRIAAAAFTLVAAVHAQTPTQTWNIAQATSATTNAGCVNGLANPADPNGFYVDPFGATYAIRCQQSSNGFVYDNVGTNAQGAYGCSKGCDNRPNCKGWHFEGTQSSGTTGSGRCYFRSVVGQFSSNTSVYAGAELISNGTPRLPCPYYNNTIFTDTQNYQWRIRCGFDTQATDTGTPLTTGTYNMTDCMRGCNSFLNAPNPCSQFSYSNAGVAIPPDGQPAGGNCYYKSGNAQEIGGGTALAAYATRVATTPVASGFSTLVTSSSAVTAAPPVSSGGSGAGQSVSSNTGSSSLSLSTSSSVSSLSSSISSGSSTASFSVISNSVSTGSSSVTTSSATSSSSVTISSSASVSSSPTIPTSSSTISSSATTSTSAAANTSPAACPAADQTLTAGNSTWAVRCGSDVYGTDILPNRATTNGYPGCFTICDTTPNCAGFSYAGSSDALGAGTCYLKAAYTNQAMVFFNPPPATLGAYRIAGTGASNPPPSSSSSISGTISSVSTTAATASPTADPPAGSYPAPGACPGVSNTNVTTSRGQSYRVQCYGETSGGSVPNQASGRSETGYTGCMIGCDANPQCIGFSWQSQTENVATDGSGGGTCYYKGGTVSFITPGNQRNVAVYKIASPPVVSTSSASTGVSSTSQSSSTLQQSSSQSLSGSSTTSQLSSSTAPSSSTSQSSATSPTSSSSTSTLQQSSSTAQSSSSSTSQPPSSSTAQSSSTTSQPPSSSSALSSTISQLSLSTTQSTSTLQQSSSTTQSSSTSQPSSSTGLSSSTSQQFTSSSQSSSTLSQSSSTVLSSSTSQLSTSQTLSSSTTTLSSSATPSSSTSSLSSSQALSSSTTTSQLSSSTAQTSTGSSTSSGLPSSSTSSVLTGLSSSSSISSSLGSTTVPATATTASFTSSTLTASQASTTSSSSSSSGTSTTSSATSSTSIIVGSPTACPGVNGTVVADPAGILYNIMCQSDIWGSDLQPFDTTTVGYQDCFATCDSNALCSGFTWLSSAGSTTGAGAGTCYQKQLLNGVNYFYRPNGVNSYPNNVAAIKRTYGQTGVAPSFTSTIATSTQTSSSLSTASSSTLTLSSSTSLQLSVSPSSSLAISSSSSSSSLLASISSSLPVTTSTNAISVTSSLLSTSSNFVVTTTTTTSSSSSSSINTRQAVATATGRPQFSCPANDRQIVQDNCGVNYILGCGVETVAGGTYPAITAASFNDCFALCSSGSVGVCISWSYFQGFCYLKAPSYGNDRFNEVRDGVVAGINIDYYDGPDQPLPARTSRSCASGVPTPFFSTTRTTRTTTSSSSLPPVFTTSIPTSSTTPQITNTFSSSVPTSNGQLSSSMLSSSIGQISSSLASSTNGQVTSSLSTSSIGQISSSLTLSSASQISSSLVPSSSGQASSSLVSSSIVQISSSSTSSSIGQVSSSLLSSSIGQVSSSLLSSSVGPATSSSSLSSLVPLSSASIGGPLSSVTIVSTSAPGISSSSSQLSSAIVSSPISSPVLTSAVSTSDFITPSRSVGVPSSLPLSSSQVSSPVSSLQISSSAEVITTPPSTQTSAEQITTTSSVPVIEYMPPPACPTGTAEDVCNNIASNTTCASNENAYNVTCGVAFTGTTIDDSEVVLPPPYDTEPFVPPTERRRSLLARQFRGFAERIPLPNIATCQSACDMTPSCKGVNFIGYECTLLSEITGTTTVPGAVAAEIVPYPEPPPGYVTPSATLPSSTSSWDATTYTSTTQSSSDAMSPSTSQSTASSPSAYEPPSSASIISSQSSPVFSGPVTIIVTPVPSPTTSTESSSVVLSSSSLISSAITGPSSYTSPSNTPNSASTSQVSQSLSASDGLPTLTTGTPSGSPAPSYSGGMSSTSSAGGPSATELSCPADNGRNYTGNSGSYWVECDMAIGGLPLDNDIANNYKRQAVTPEVCMFGCEIYGDACVAVNFRPGGCEYFSSIDTLSPSDGTIALFKADAVPGRPSGYPVVTFTATSSSTSSTQTGSAGLPSGYPGQSDTITSVTSSTSSAGPPSQYPGSPSQSSATSATGLSSSSVVSGSLSSIPSGSSATGSSSSPSSYLSGSPSGIPATSSSPGQPSSYTGVFASPTSSTPTTLVSGTSPRPTATGSSTLPPRVVTVTVCKNIRSTTVFPTFTVTTCTAGSTCATAVTRF